MPSDKYAMILQAAMDLFSEKGYEGTSMRDIADAVGLQPGSLYAHITGKEELLTAIVDRVSEQFLDAAAVAIDDTTQPVDLRLRRFVEAHLRIIAENKASATVFLHEWRSLEGERRARALHYRDEYERRLTELIAEGVERGEFRSIDTHLAAVAVLSLVNWAYTWFSPSGERSVESIAEEFTSLLVSGFTQSQNDKATTDRSDGTKRSRRTMPSRSAAK